MQQWLASLHITHILCLEDVVYGEMLIIQEFNA